MESLYAAGEVSRHKCLIYDGHPSEQLPVVVPLLMSGLREKRRCLYLGDPQMTRMVEAALNSKGVDTKREIESGALIFSSDRSHLDRGFNPKAMIDMLCALIDQALKDGFFGLCATGDMRWELGDDQNFDRLLEYEAMLERVFRDKPLMGICQYHRSTVPARAVQDALLTHRSAFFGETLNEDNLFYLPPELVLGAAGRAARDRQGEWMSSQIVRIMQAEEKRDRALAEQKRLAGELARANEDLERRVRERTLELESANRELDAFARTVSHDLRTPLRHIQGFIALLKEDAGKRLPAKADRHLSRIAGASAAMSRLIDDLLAFSRSSRAEASKSRTELGPLVREVIGALKPDLKGRKIAWAVGELPAADCDAALIRQVFANLIGNAVKFTRGRAKAAIRITAEKGAEGVTIRVQDNGAGFEPEYSHKLFKAFERLHSQTDFEGTGLGLANVQRIINRHGGRVWAEGLPGKGASFYFTLP